MRKQEAKIEKNDAQNFSDKQAEEEETVKKRQCAKNEGGEEEELVRQETEKKRREDLLGFSELTRTDQSDSNLASFFLSSAV